MSAVAQLDVIIATAGLLAQLVAHVDANGVLLDDEVQALNRLGCLTHIVP